MDLLVKSLKGLELDTNSQVDTKSLQRCMRELLESKDASSVDAALVKRWCERIFQTPQLEDLLPTAWQLFGKFCPNDDFDCSGNTLLQVWRDRTLLLNDKIPKEDLIDLSKDLLLVFRRTRTSRIVVSAIFEMAGLLAKLSSEGHESLVLIVKEALWQQDELVLHHARSLSVTLLKVLPNTGALWMDLCTTINTIDESIKMRYLLLKDLLEADLHVEGFTNPRDLIKLFKVLTHNKSLAPSVADCIILLLQHGEYKLDDCLFNLEDGLGLLGLTFFPRLVKRMPRIAEALLNTVDTGTNKGVRIYCALCHSIISNESPIKLVLRLEAISHALISPFESERLVAFACICRSTNMKNSFNRSTCLLVRRHIVHTMLDGTSDSRQQTVASLKHLMEVHFARLYKLVKCNNSASTEEIHTIAKFWCEIVDLCTQSLCEKGYYNKNDLCLSILSCFMTVWQEKLVKCANTSIKEKLSCLLTDSIIKSLLGDSALDTICTCVRVNTYDTIRTTATELLWCIASVGDGLSFLLGHPEEILSELKDHRVHIIDGASRIIRLFCHIYESHEAIADELLNKIKNELACLDTNKPETLAASHILGWMTCLQFLKITNVQARTVAENCRVLCYTVLEFISHPSPEGHSVVMPDTVEDDEESEEVHEDMSFSVMTFCWRSIKIGSTLLSYALDKQLESSPSHDDLRTYGSFLVEIIMKIRHPGAFMSLARPLKSICKLCYGSANPKSNSIPELLLEMAMDICHKQPSIQTTRRSAGLPVCISSIVSSSGDACQRRRMLNRYLNFNEHGLDTVKADPYVVHNLNILRQIFRDSNLSEDVVLYIPKAFSLCSKALISPSWVVRNSGMMLFTALMNRTFGVRHSAEDYAAINFVDPRTIWAKFGCLFRSADDFADFAILQRLRYSPGGEAAHGKYYKEALDFALGRLKSSKAKERKMTVRLLVHMCESDTLRDRIIIKLEELNDAKEANLVHGLLLLLGALEEKEYLDKDQIKRLLNLVPRSFLSCYPIRALVGGFTVTEDQVPMRVEMKKVLDCLKGRAMHKEECERVIGAALEFIQITPSHNPMVISLMDAFEAFWVKDYDLEGMWRATLIRMWRSLPYWDRSIRRIWYLALTDDDSDIRFNASINFGVRASISHLLEFLLREHQEDVFDLIEYMPKLGNVKFIADRQVLFEPEALNGFKDPSWEHLVIRLFK